MRIFNFFIRVRAFDVEGNEIEKIEKRTIRANHLQGAIRQLYQNESNMTRIINILGTNHI